MGASIRRSSARVNGRPRRGSTSSPILPSVSRHRWKAAAYTWSINSQQNQLTPWSNDPVTDRPGEVILHSRRRRRHALDANRSADSRRSAAVCRQARSGIQPVRACIEWHCTRAFTIRRPRRSDQNLPFKDSKSVGPKAPSLHHRICRVGVGSFTRWFRAVSRDGD